MRVVINLAEIPAELDAVFAVGPGNCVRHLPARFIRKTRTDEERGRAKGKSIRDGNLRRQAQWVGKCRRVQQRAVLVGRSRLRVFKFKIASILVSDFIHQIGGERGVQLGYTPGVLYVIIAETGNTKSVCRLGLNACRRCPAHAVERKRRAVLLVHLPVQLGEDNVLIAFTGDRA